MRPRGFIIRTVHAGRPYAFHTVATSGANALAIFRKNHKRWHVREVVEEFPPQKKVKV